MFTMTRFVDRLIGSLYKRSDVVRQQYSAAGHHVTLTFDGPVMLTGAVPRAYLRNNAHAALNADYSMGGRLVNGGPPASVGDVALTYADPATYDRANNPQLVRFVVPAAIVAALCEDLMFLIIPADNNGIRTPRGGWVQAYVCPLTLNAP